MYGSDQKIVDRPLVVIDIDMPLAELGGHIDEEILLQARGALRDLLHMKQPQHTVVRVTFELLRLEDVRD